MPINAKFECPDKYELFEEKQASFCRHKKSQIVCALEPNKRNNHPFCSTTTCPENYFQLEPGICENEDGKTMCLRPDLTVASCINYLKKKTNSKIYYSGQAYRRSNNKNSSFINEQLGIEILGSKNQIQDDFKIISTILSSAKKIKNKKIKVRVGDISLFKNLINALDMPERWKLRLIRHFWRPNYFEELLKRLEINTDIDAMKFDADKNRFNEMKKMDNNKMVAGRSISEILKRFDKKIKDPRSFSNGKKIVKIIKSFLKINCKLSKLDKKLLDFAKKNNLKKNIFKDFKSIQNLKKLKQEVIFITNFADFYDYRLA